MVMDKLDMTLQVYPANEGSNQPLVSKQDRKRYIACDHVQHT